MTKLTGIITSESKLEGNLGVRNEINVGIIGTGPRGLPGSDGHTPIKGIDYFDGIDGEQGIQGIQGTDGKDGYTPQKGVDYWTESDIAEIKTYIDESLGVIENGTY